MPNTLSLRFSSKRRGTIRTVFNGSLIFEEIQHFKWFMYISKNVFSVTYIRLVKNDLMPKPLIITRLELYFWKIYSYHSIDSLYPIESVNQCVPSEYSQLRFKIARGW